MAFYDKNLGHWVAQFYFNGVCYRKRVKAFKTKKLALQWEQDKFKELEKLSHSNLTVNELFTLYLNDQQTSVKDSSMQKYLHIQKKLDYLKDKQATSITSKDILKFQQHLYKLGYSPNHINDIITKLSSAYKHGITHYDLKFNPCTGVKRVKDNTIKDINFYTLKEFNQYQNVIDDLRFKAFFNFLYYSGCRKGETIALKWHDLNFENSTIRINKTLAPRLSLTPTPPKTQSSNRTINLPQNTMDILKELYDHNKQFKNFSNDWYIFNNIEPLRENNIDYHNRKYAKLAGLKHIKIHDFRHSHASLLISNNANVLLVSKRLGHSDTQMTLNTYAHLFENQEKEIINIIDDLSNKND